jgi:hypothetical protein
MSLILNIPTLNDGIQDFEELFLLHQRAISVDRDTITLDFSDCKFLRHNAVAFLGGLVRFNQNCGKTVIINWDSIQEKVCANLRQNGFYTAHTGDGNGWAGNSIPYREERLQDQNKFLEYLRDLWLAKGCANMDLDEDAQREILGKVVEIYVNACEHSDSQIGTFVCGQHYPRRGKLSLSLIDFGVGIPHRVRNHLNKPSMEASDAIEWAMAQGNSTCSKYVPRGTGLDALRNFVKEHEGKLEILSDRGYIVYSGEESPSSGVHSTPFAGTIVNITLKCLNWQYHQFTTVDSGEPLF